VGGGRPGIKQVGGLFPVDMSTQVTVIPV
jgi:hypothetical protein